MSDTWHTVTIAGKQVEVFEPANHRFGLIHLAGDSASTCVGPQLARLCEELKLACVRADGRRSWWVDRPCVEFDPQLTAETFIVHHLLPFVLERWNLGPRAVGLHGIGMGGQGALRLAFKHALLFPAVAAVAPALEFHELYGYGEPLDDMYDSKEQCRQDTAIMHVPPHDYPPHVFYCADPADGFWYRGADRLHEKLNALGIPHEVDMVTTSDGGAADYAERMMERSLRFLQAGLAKESLKIL
jgi:S-formylglutathione hydrolase